MKYSADDIRIIDNLIPESLRFDLEDLTRHPIWHYGHRSTDKVGLCHWNHRFAGGDYQNRDNCLMELKENAPPCINQLWDLLSRTILSGHEPTRSYVNAHTYGVEGYCHRDNDDTENYFSTIIYPMGQWEPNWGGETLFYDENGDIIKAAIPKPGRVVHFPGAIYHRASGVTRLCENLRTTYVFKTQWA